MRVLAVALVAVLLTGCVTSPSSTSGTNAPSSTTPSGPSDCLSTLAGLDLQTATIADLQAALKDGRVTSAQLVDAYAARIAAFDQKGDKPTNSVQVVLPTARAEAAALDAERAAGHVRGPLHGIPILLKDNIAANGAPTTAGSIALEKNVPPNEATLTKALRDAGMIVLGKTKMSEFAQWISLNNPNGYSSLGGQVVNPYNFGDPSGSSSGSGVAGAMAFAPVTIGTETQGSILGPSNDNSLVGVKPTMGLVTRTGVIPLAGHFDTPGPMGRHVADVAAVLSAIAGPDPKDAATAPSASHLPPGKDYAALLSPDALKGVRVGYNKSFTGALFAASLVNLTKLGATLVEVAWDGTDDNAGTSELALIPNEFKAQLNAYLAHDAGPGLPVKDLTDIILYNQQHPDKVKYGQDLLIASDATVGDATLAEASGTAARAASQAALDQVFASNNVAVIVGPGLAYYQAAAEAGYPTVIVPEGYRGQSPEGLSFFGPAWSEAKLLAYAYAFEGATQLRQPPTAVNAKLLPVLCGPAPALGTTGHAWASMGMPGLGTRNEELLGVTR